MLKLNNLVNPISASFRPLSWELLLSRVGDALTVQTKAEQRFAWNSGWFPTLGVSACPCVLNAFAGPGLVGDLLVNGDDCTAAVSGCRCQGTLTWYRLRRFEGSVSYFKSPQLVFVQNLFFSSHPVCVCVCVCVCVRFMLSTIVRCLLSLIPFLPVCNSVIPSKPCWSHSVLLLLCVCVCVCVCVCLLTSLIFLLCVASPFWMCLL